MMPKHVAIVMDGNGRWATSRGLTRMQGHSAGVDAAIDIVKYCGKLGISYLTLYAFSSENWQRPKTEVTGLMTLLHSYLTKEADSLVENGVRVQTIGVTNRLPVIVQTALEAVKRKTAKGNKLHLTLALSYGAKDEITRAVKTIVDDQIKSEDINESLISQYLDTAGTPDPDLWIRTSGEMRLSNFLLWQISYSELYVTPTYWPDFNRHELDLALEEFQRRQRRFGQTPEQVSALS